MFMPQPITYPEDKLRRDFFKDHPWELARPRIVLEQDGKDAQRTGWSQMRQHEKGLDGERLDPDGLQFNLSNTNLLYSVVQRQLWLLQNVEGMTKARAYDIARQEFYDLRYQEEVERRVAKEEALATGAYFGMSHLEVGTLLEDKWYEEWKDWAKRETLTAQQGNKPSYAGPDAESSNIEDLKSDASPDGPEDLTKNGNA